jgi:hypothetical protein
MADAPATQSALRAWAETVFDGHSIEFEPAAGQSLCAPEDLISVYSGAAVSCRHRNEAAKV